MSEVDCPPKSRRLNVLLLDGGGVRGLSSLLVLQELIRLINEYIKEKADQGETGEAFVDLKPHEIFDFVAGTSTGGLISIMLAKVGLSVEDCIKQYNELSEKIFKGKHLRGSITRGLAVTKFSGKVLRDCIISLLKKNGLQEDHPMVCDRDNDKIACAVVCREHEHGSKYSPLKDGPALFCSIPCDQHIIAPVCDAACATSAAPTYFPVVNINGRFFVDGGMEYNNPSWAVYKHCYEGNCVESETEGERLYQPIVHNDLDFSLVRYINIGTGTKPTELPDRTRDKFAKFIPGAIRMGLFLKQTLKEIAVNSEIPANWMKSIARVSDDRIRYERFSAGNGVCWIKLNMYRELPKINKLTEEYIATPQTQNSLRRVAKEIADEYLEKRRADAASTKPPTAPPTASVSAQPGAQSLPVLSPHDGYSLRPEESTVSSSRDQDSGSHGRSLTTKSSSIEPMQASDITKSNGSTGVP